MSKQKKRRFHISITEREHATILAALRLWQGADEHNRGDLRDIAEAVGVPSATKKSISCVNESILQVARYRTPATLPGRKENEMKRNVVIAAYALEIVGDIEPKLRGPYKNTDTRDRAAKRLRKKDAGKENGIFALDLMSNGKIRVLAYSAGFLDEAVAADEGIRFINHYQCPDDGTEWTDRWSCACNDKCPTCNKEIEPYESEEIDAPSEPLKSIDRPGPRKDARNALRKFGA